MRARTGEIGFVICAHSLAEIYSTLSGLPTKPKISPAQAWRLIQENVGSAQVVELSASDYSLVVQRTSDLGLSGGVIYDALIARAAEKANVDHLLTFNEKDYRRVLSPGGSLLLVP